MKCFAISKTVPKRTPFLTAYHEFKFQSAASSRPSAMLSVFRFWKSKNKRVAMMRVNSKCALTLSLFWKKTKCTNSLLNFRCDIGTHINTSKKCWRLSYWKPVLLGVVLWRPYIFKNRNISIALLEISSRMIFESSIGVGTIKAFKRSFSYFAFLAL